MRLPIPPLRHTLQVRGPYLYRALQKKSRFDSFRLSHYGDRQFKKKPRTHAVPLFCGSTTRMKWIAVSLFSLTCSLLVLPGCSLWPRSSPAAKRLPLPSSVPQGDAPLVTTLIPGLTGAKDGTESNPQYVTEEDLLKIVNEFQRAAIKDTYRFPIPKDVTGANVYKATLTRLQDYEAKHPGAYGEILAFTRGRAYEGLREYDKAIAQYQVVSQSKHALQTEATKAVEVITRFRDLKRTPLTATTPLDYLKSLDQQITAWQELQKQYPNTEYEALAKEEEERLDQAKVAFLVINRHRIEDGNESVVLAYGQLLAKHRESKYQYRYQVEFGDFYFALAQEYVAQNDPQSLQFDSTTFEELGRSAVRLYAQVAQEDGIIEKLEAKGKLEALEAYMAKIGKLSR